MSDYINRDLAVKAAIAPCNKCTIESKEKPSCDDCKLYGVAQEIYNHIPAADVRPVVRGKWVSVPHKLSRVCSICWHDEPYKFAEKDVEVYNYCPNCGAKMEES